MQINYGLVVLSPKESGVEILHFCGYEEQPTQIDINSLTFELQTDPEFGLIDRTDYVVCEAWDELMTEYRKMLDNREDLDVQQ